MMKVAVFSTKRYDQEFLTAANQGHGHEFTFLDVHLTPQTAPLAEEHDAVCAFVNDTLNEATLVQLAKAGVKLVALRCAGFNNVDLPMAQSLGIQVVRVPAYSPYAVAEHALALIMTLNRNTHRAYNRVREANFALDGLMGFDVHGKTIGIIGTGKIGQVMAGLLQGFGCRLVAYDLYPNQTCRDLGVEYLSLNELCAQSDIITLHCPLTPETYHLISTALIQQMKRGVMIINTSRGAIIDTLAVIEGLKSGRIGYLGLDVYEEEDDLFFEDLSNKVIQDDTFTRLLTFPNVLITGHQAFFTRQALQNIAETTVANITTVGKGDPCPNVVKPS
jgi:D-lactate dehydrogenase